MAIFRLPKRTFAWLIAYLLAASTILGGLGLCLYRHHNNLREATLSYLLPDSWVFAADTLLTHFLGQQLSVVLVNGAATVGLATLSITLFWLKEIVSASYERESALADQPIREIPLWFQAWEEAKLFVAILAGQATVFWIGYHPSPERKWAAAVLSFVLLAFSYAADFLPPIFQRHGGRYSRILKVLLAHPAATGLFGALFAAPPLLVGIFWDPSWGFWRALAILMTAEVVTIGWACIAGTWLGSRMMPAYAETLRSSAPTRALAWAAFVAIVSTNTYVYGALGLSLHHKSKILKCSFLVDWDSWSFSRPNLLDVLRRKDVSLSASFYLDITNPTRIDVELEENRLELIHDEKIIARTTLTPARIRAGQSIRQRVTLHLQLHPSTLRKGRALVRWDAYQLILYLSVTEFFDFPMYLRGAE